MTTTFTVDLRTVLTRRFLASAFWDLSLQMVRANGLEHDPRAWAFIAWHWLRLRIWGAT